MKAFIPFKPPFDYNPKYTVKEVAEMVEISSYAVRYYDNSGLLPHVERSGGNIRLFSEYSISWLRLVHCLRASGLTIENIRHYIELCQEGDVTIKERAEIIFRQKKRLKQQLCDLQDQMIVLQDKEDYYKEVLDNRSRDTCNPASFYHQEEETVLD